jgi:hypothetical protein
MKEHMSVPVNALVNISSTNDTTMIPAKRPDLRDKAIDIKGKQYVQVSHRIIYFNETYPEGSIVTELISTPDAQTVIIKASVWPDRHRQFTGYSQATWGDGYINKTSALENAETSAVGRALAFMGIGVIDSIASVDEVNKANNKASTSGQNPRAALTASINKTQATSGKSDIPNKRPATKVVAPEPPAQTAPPIANDSDIPDEIGSKPTSEEMAEIKKQLGKFEIDRDKLKTYVLKSTGRDSAKDLTKRQWDTVISNLTTAQSNGSLADLVK